MTHISLCLSRSLSLLRVHTTRSFVSFFLMVLSLSSWLSVPLYFSVFLWLVTFSGQLLSQLCFHSEMSVMSLLDSTSSARVCVSVCVRVCACFRTGTGQCHAGAFPRPNSSCERQKGRDRERNTGSHCALMSSLPPFLPQFHPFYHWDSIVCSGTVTLPQLPSFENEKETNMFSVFPTFLEDLGACVCILTCCFKCFKP